ncbi:hypothetical protein E2562_023207 [Oryza meyeriana var. granulata]|uniref:F-box/LRR-repeat protein 15/At3g58940/PEG3-like LRR domain-containing protein n=1 Tax=Oryza meyeriana var. granulata TaxID=110450 RepID=A0A6G1BZX3_9ORYZ|nr:hypothetical protein E2562_023207 [Oryza meyeriana var. granulata]
MVVAGIRALGDTTIDEPTVVRRFLRAASPRYMNVVTSIEQCVDLKTLTVEDLIGRYKSYDERVRFSYGDMNKALTKEKKGGECATKNHDHGGGRGKAGGRCGCDRDDNDASVNSNDSKRKSNRKKGKFYNCGIRGHLTKECRKPRKETALLAMADDEPWIRRGLARRPPVLHVSYDRHGLRPRPFNFPSGAGACLRTLHLCRVTLSPVIAEELSSGCPALEHVRLDGCNCAFSRLASVSLKKLLIHECSHETPLALATPNLVSLHLYIDALVSSEEEMASLAGATITHPAGEHYGLLKSLHGVTSLDVRRFSTNCSARSKKKERKSRFQEISSGQHGPRVYKCENLKSVEFEFYEGPQTETIWSEN